MNDVSKVSVDGIRCCSPVVLHRSEVAGQGARSRARRRFTSAGAHSTSIRPSPPMVSTGAATCSGNLAGEAHP